jgi:hypothetical protein
LDEKERALKAAMTMVPSIPQDKNVQLGQEAQLQSNNDMASMSKDAEVLCKEIEVTCN